MSTISKVHARQILDSRGKPTVEVEITTEKGVYRAAVPSGASTGIHEACELRDGDSKLHHGQSVLKAVKNVNEVIGPQLMKQCFELKNQRKIDEWLIKLDGSPNKTNLGANAILGVSLAVARAAAAECNVPLFEHIASLAGVSQVSLPIPSFNVINGGSHAGNELAIQEFMIMPVGASSFSEAIQMGCEIFHILKKLVKEAYGQDAVNVGDEGGFAPNVGSTEEALDLLSTAIATSGYEGKIRIALDVAASEFYTESKYDLEWKDSQAKGRSLKSGSELVSFYKNLIEKYPSTQI